MSSALLCSIKSAISFASLVRSYAVKSAGTASLMGLGKGKKASKGMSVEKIVIPVETDPEKLVNYVCGSNLYKDGEEIKIKPDSEYPDWLWGLRSNKPRSIHELDPETKEYWVRVRRQSYQEQRKKKKIRRFRK